MSNTRNESLGITNQTSSPAIFASAFAVAPGQDGYAQPLSAFPGNASPTIIPAKSGNNDGSGNITLDKTYDDHGTQKPILIYDLIGMKPDNLFPLFDQAAEPQDCATHPSPKCQGGYTTYYDDITMTQDQADGMAQAYQFSQEILAYPEVDVTKTFMSILRQYATDPVKLEQAIDAFFKTQTKKYQSCTLTAYVAASTYTQQFAFSWAGLQSRYTYFVFSVNQDQQPTGEGFSRIGRIVFAKSSNAPNPADVSDANGGYTISYLPDGRAERPLKLINASLVTASNPDFPDVSMLLSFALKSVFTGNANDNVVWPIMAGKIDGFNVIAVGQDATTDTGWYKFFHPQTAQQWMALIGSIIGLGFAFYFLAEKIYQLYKWIKEYRAKNGRPPDNQEIEQQRAEIDNKLQNVVSERERLQDRSGIGGRIARDYGSLSRDSLSLQQSRLDVNVDMQIERYRDAIALQGESLAELARVQNTPDIMEAVGQLVDAKDALDGIKNRQDLGNARAQLDTTLRDVRGTIATVTQEFAQELGQQAVEQIATRQRSVERVREELDDLAGNEELEEREESPFEI